MYLYMHIAVIVFGRLHRCVESYENIAYALGMSHHTMDFFLSSDNSNEDLLNDFKSLYKPKAYSNEPIPYNDEFSKYPLQDWTNPPNMWRHFKNKNRVFGLFEEYCNSENVTYDIVVSFRFELFFHHSFNFNQELDENTIYIPNHNDFTGINDQIAYGKADVMKKYNNINPIELLENGLSRLHPESLTIANLIMHGIQIKRVELDYQISK